MEPKCARGIRSCGLFRAFSRFRRKSFPSAKVNFEKVLKIAANAAACQYCTNLEPGTVSGQNFVLACGCGGGEGETKTVSRRRGKSGKNSERRFIFTLRSVVPELCTLAEKLAAQRVPSLPYLRSSCPLETFIPTSLSLLPRLLPSSFLVGWLHFRSFVCLTF